jgi:hypothetical protein
MSKEIKERILNVRLYVKEEVQQLHDSLEAAVQRVREKIK